MLDDLMGFTSQFMGYIFKIKIEMHKFHTIICYSFMNFGRKYTLVFWWIETSLWCPCGSMNWNILVVSLWLQGASYKIHDCLKSFQALYDECFIIFHNTSLHLNQALSIFVSWAKNASYNCLGYQCTFEDRLMINGKY